MPMSSISGHYLPAPATAFDEGEPVGSWRAVELQQNLLHLTDEFAQTRINWIATNEDGIYDASPPPDAADYVIWSQTYVHRWLAPGKPANVDVHIWGDGLLASVRLVPYTSQEVAAPVVPVSVFSVPLDMFAGPMAVSYTHQNTPENTAVYEQGWYSPAPVTAVGADGIFQPRVCLMRLEIQCITEEPMQIFGVCLREFA